MLEGLSEGSLLQILQELPVIEKALEAAALMLGRDKSRGYCLEMICADPLMRRGDTEVVQRR